MNILFLTNNLDVTRPLYEWLRDEEGTDCVTLWEEPLTAALFQPGRPLAGTEFIVSYNYLHLIRKDTLKLYPNKIINLHISYLPWNRGKDPNYWSFLENTPKGVTIHLVDEGLDTGDVLLQKEVWFDEQQETFASSYQTLQNEIQTLFREHWDGIKACQIAPVKQIGMGSYHKHAQMPESVDWRTLIARYKTERDSALKNTI